MWLGLNAMLVTRILAACFGALPLFFTLLIVLQHPPSDTVHGFAAVRDVVHGAVQNNTSLGLEDIVVQQNLLSDGKFLGGLIADGFDDDGCASRYSSFLYRKISHHKPFSSLISRLRSYEDLHRRCGPKTESYRKAIELLKAGQKVKSTDCKYVVWISFSGLGNRILALSSTFLYSLLTNRVMLVDQGKDMADLFCEPFPRESWWLPLDFPLLKKFSNFNQKSHHSYGFMLKNNAFNNILTKSWIPSHVYVHLVHDYGDYDKLFFCDDHQNLLAEIPWLIVKTDNYFIPSLFLIPSFQKELSYLFPQKTTVFHHLGCYLFHPANQVWGLITRYYQAYLAKADERVGVQVRVFDSRPGPFTHVMDQILACSLKEKLLPEVSDGQTTTLPRNSKLISVLVTSLSMGYSENLRNMYWEHPTVTGEIVVVHQPSHEEYQQTGKQMHNRKAWAEMYLLSLSDVLVTSSWSTFGYVAQGLGGLRPWILSKTSNDTSPDPPCHKAMSMEPCFHAPPFYDCKAKRGTDTGLLVSHVRHCEDMSWGLKVVDVS